jgi:hypothetical protein
LTVKWRPRLDESAAAGLPIQAACETVMSTEGFMQYSISKTTTSIKTGGGQIDVGGIKIAGSMTACKS